MSNTILKLGLAKKKMYCLQAFSGPGQIVVLDG